MKKLLMILGMLWLMPALLTAGNTPLDRALQQAKEQHKTVLLMISQEGCPMCIYMKRNALKDPEVTAYLRKHYIMTTLDRDFDDIPKRFSTFVTPTFFFIDADTGKIVDEPFRGGAKADAFLRILKIYNNDKGK